MQRMLVMTVIGPDRPGLVDTVAGLVAEHEGNWLESRMSRLGGHFAGILRVEVPASKDRDLVLPEPLTAGCDRDSGRQAAAEERVAAVEGHDLAGHHSGLRTGKEVPELRDRRL